MKLILFISLIFLSILATSCRDLKETTVTGVDHFFINKINADGIDADLNLKIKNTNNFGFSIYPSEFDIIYSGLRLGKAKLNKRVHIDGNTERVYSFNLKSFLNKYFNKTHTYNRITFYVFYAIRRSNISN